MPPKGSRKGKAPVRGHGKGKAPAKTIPNSAVPANTNQAESTPAVSNPAKAEQVQPPPASFMGLPPEIQQRIYRYALYTPYNLPLIPKREPNTTLQKTKRAILRVNKEVYNGASVVFYHENKFQFEIESHGKKLVDAVFKPHLGDMRHIILRYSYSPMLEVRSIDKSIARFLQMVLDNCPALKTLVLFLQPDWGVGYDAEFEASCLLQDVRRLVKTNKALEALLPKVQDYLAIVATGTDVYFSEADTSLPIAPEVKWGGKNLEDWFPTFGQAPNEPNLDDVMRLWLFSKKGWSTMRWLKNERCDFQERARVEDGESEVEEPDEDEGMDEEMDEDREKEPIEEIDWADVAEEERDESTDEDEEEEL